MRLLCGCAVMLFVGGFVGARLVVLLAGDWFWGTCLRLCDARVCGMAISFFFFSFSFSFSFLFFLCYFGDHLVRHREARS